MKRRHHSHDCSICGERFVCTQKLEAAELSACAAARTSICDRCLRGEDEEPTLEQQARLDYDYRQVPDEDDLELEFDEDAVLA